MHNKVKALIGATALFTGLSLAQAAPASAHAGGPTVTFDQGLHFVKGSQLSDTSTAPSLNVSSKWHQSDPNGICQESGFVYDNTNGTYRTQWSGVRTQVAFSGQAGHQFESYVSATDCSGYQSNNYSYTTWNLAQQNAASYSRGWVNSGFCACWSDGTVKYSTGRGQTATYTGYGNNFAIVTDRAPGRGTADIYFDGVYKASINDNSSVKSNRVVDFSAYTRATGYHTVMLRVTNGRIDIDAFATS